jgi:uncharacterized membrane protein
MLLAAMKNGGKASVVVPLTALYPLVVVLAAPVVLGESITRRQGIGVICALIAVTLLNVEVSKRNCATTIAKKPRHTLRHGTVGT